MGASPTNEPRSVPAAVLSTQTPEVEIEEAAEGDETRVFVSGTMYHTGLNANAWGLTKTGAEATAEDLIGCDYTAAHPDVRGNKYDRSIAEGKGAPIGTVVSTDVVTVDSADLRGGGYTAAYRAEVKDPAFKEKMQAGLYDTDGYGVSIGIYADPESATCSVCDQEMASESCGHTRGETVEAEDGEEQIAGPLYDAADADHLAHVWRPAYEGATAEVQAADAVSDDGNIAAYSMDGAQDLLTASEVLGRPFDAVSTGEDDDTSETAETDDAPESSAYHVALSSVTEDTPSRPERGSYHVQLTNDD